MILDIIQQKNDLPPPLLGTRQPMQTHWVYQFVAEGDSIKPSALYDTTAIALLSDYRFYHINYA